MKYLLSKKRFNNDKNYFDVEKIITRKIDGKNKYYLIKWVGYPLKDCSWEPVSHLQNISHMVEIFDNNFPSSIDKKGLKRYLYVINRKESHIIRIKNPFLKAKCFSKIKKKKNRNIIISIDNSRININLENKEIQEEKKEEEKEIVKNDTETEINICNNNDEDKQNLNLSENLNELNMKVDYEKNDLKLKRPILIR